eukprot:gene3640-biopygen8255
MQRAEPCLLCLSVGPFHRCGPTDRVFHALEVIERTCLGPQAPIRPRPLQHLQVASVGRIGARVRVPRAPIRPRPLQRLQPAHAGGATKVPRIHLVAQAHGPPQPRRRRPRARHTRVDAALSKAGGDRAGEAGGSAEGAARRGEGKGVVLVQMVHDQPQLERGGE